MAYENRRAWAQVFLTDGSVVAGEVPRDLTDNSLLYTLPVVEGLFTEVQAGNYITQPGKSGLSPLTYNLSLVSVYAGLIGGTFKEYSFEMEEILETQGEPDVVLLHAECTGMLRRSELATFTMGAQEVRGVNLEYRLDVYKLTVGANVAHDIDIPNKVFRQNGEDIFPQFT